MTHQGLRGRADAAASPAAQARFRNTKFQTKLNEVNLGKVQAAIDSGKLDAKNSVDTGTMIKAGLFTRAKGGVKLLGGGEIKTKIDFSVWRASQSAIAAVEKAGGSVKILAPKKEEAAEPKGKNKRMALEIAKGGGKPKSEKGEKAGKAAKSEADQDKTEEKPKGEKAERCNKGGKKPERKATSDPISFSRFRACNTTPAITFD